MEVRVFLPASQKTRPTGHLVGRVFFATLDFLTTGKAL
ncbi:hypothetical protein LCAZH_2950 [Lacticaseibacillus paracasei]|nr:hypothetical protein LCAZH_2950 [Lacticaseibacillus paracasei]